MTLGIAPGLLDTAGASMLEYPVAIGTLFGWLHRGVSRRGVILCGTHGYEQHCAHRSWRGLALRIAATGCTTLRFDYPGEGDSGGQDTESVRACVEAIHQAIAYLRREGDVSEIVLVGLRLGGAFAALAAQGADIERLILIAPVISGRAYQREMKFQAQMFNLRPDGSPLPDEPGAFNVCGFYLHKRFIDDIATIDLRTAERAAPRILLLGTGSEGLAARYAALGSDVATAPFPDLQQLVGDAMTSKLDEKSASLIADFAARDLRESLINPSRSSPTVTIEGQAWRETPVRFGENLFGVLCRPSDRTPGAPLILFINMGANVRSGHGRQTTNFARKLAEIGATSLRMDLAGVGDSPDRHNGTTPYYNLEALDDVREAIDYLSGLDSGPIVIAGTCNGAYLAFHAACRDTRIRGAVIANLYCFDWDLAHDGIPFSERPPRSTQAYASLLRQGTAWRRVLSGQVPVFSILRSLLRRGGRRLLRKTTRTILSGQQGSSIFERIAALRRRGARLIFIYSSGDLGLADFHAHLGKSPQDLTRLLGEPVRILEDVDHTLATRKAQEGLYEALRGLVIDLRNERR